jgi:hypothetical protein
MDLDQYVIVPQLRVWHFANPYAALFSIAIDDECLHDVFSLQFLVKSGCLAGNGSDGSGERRCRRP